MWHGDDTDHTPVLFHRCLLFSDVVVALEPSDDDDDVNAFLVPIFSSLAPCLMLWFIACADSVDSNGACNWAQIRVAVEEDGENGVFAAVEPQWWHSSQLYHAVHAIDVRQAYNSLSDYSHFRISLSGWQASSLTLTLPSCCIVLCRHLFLFTNSASFYYFSYFTWCLHLLVVFAAAAVVSLCHCSLLPGFFCSARQAADANGANHSPALFGDGSCP